MRYIVGKYIVKEKRFEELVKGRVDIYSIVDKIGWNYILFVNETLFNNNNILRTEKD